MSFTSAEIGSQPAIWEDPRVPQIAEQLPARGEHVGIVGCGTSYYMMQSYACYREQEDHGTTDVFPASLVPERRWDVLLALSRSGATTEVIDALRSSRAGRTIALTGTEGSPIADSADLTLCASFANEHSIVQTRFATTALLMLLSTTGYPVERSVRDVVRGAYELPEGLLRGRSHFVLVGSGWSYGIANEGALKLREMAACWSESYPALEYRHGPIAAAGSRTLVWGFGEVDRALVDAVALTGAAVHWPECDPVASLVGVQQLGLRLAVASNRDPDQPMYLSRSVVLDGAPQQESDVVLGGDHS